MICPHCNHNIEIQPRPLLITWIEQYDFMQKVVEIVAEVMQVRSVEILGDNRLQKFTKPRHLCWLLINQISPGIKFKRIGQHFGKDHTTITHQIKVIQHHVKVEDGLRDQYNKCYDAVMNHLAEKK